MLQREKRWPIARKLTLLQRQDLIAANPFTY